MRIIVEGNPVAKKRPRFARRGKFVATYNPQKKEEGSFLARAKGQIGRKMAGPLRVDCWFYIPRPKSHYGRGRNSGRLLITAPKHIMGKFDVDNLLKHCLDALNGYAWDDDGQIIALTGIKAYADDGQPRTEIEVMEIASEF